MACHVKVNFEDDLIDVIRNAVGEVDEKKFKQAAMKYWKYVLVTDLINDAFED